MTTLAERSMSTEERYQRMEQNIRNLLEFEDSLVNEIVTPATVRRIAVASGTTISNDAAETIAEARNKDAVKFIENVIALAERKTITETDVESCFLQSTGKRLFIEVKKTNKTKETNAE